jgi:hypothetical protein
MWKTCVVLLAVAGSAWGQPSVMCPSLPHNAKVAAKDIEGGIELDFTVPSDPTLMRARVHMIETQHNHVPSVTLVPSKAEAVDTSNGARLVVMADDPARVDDLRQQMRERVGDCLSHG